MSMVTSVSDSYYSYRIAVCDPAGFCGAESNAAGLIHSAAKESVMTICGNKES